MSLVSQKHPLIDTVTEIPTSRRLPLTQEPIPNESECDDYRTHTLEETPIKDTVRALWNGTPVYFIHSCHDVHPDRILIGRSKRRDFPILCCKVFNHLLFDEGEKPELTGFVAYPRPVHAERYEEAGTYSLMGGPADALLGSVGSISFVTHEDSEMGKTADIHWLQGSVNLRKVQLSTQDKILTPSITKHYFNWDVKLVKLAFEYFQQNGYEQIRFTNTNISLRQYARQSAIFKAAAAKAGFEVKEVEQPPSDDPNSKRLKTLVMTRKLSA